MQAGLLLARGGGRAYEVLLAPLGMGTVGMAEDGAGNAGAGTTGAAPAVDVGGRRVLQPAHWPRPRGYANGMVAEGRILVTGGVVGWDVEGRFPATFLEQARLTFENIATILAEADAEPEHLVRLTWYVTDMDEYLAQPRELGRVYRSVFGASFPAMAAVQVVRLVEKAAKLEIEATAVLPLHPGMGTPRSRDPCCLAPP